MGAPKESYVKRARVSAHAGWYLLLAGCVLLGSGLLSGQFFWPIAVLMAIVGIILQFPRQYAWLHQNDALEFLCLAVMPIILGALAYFWLAPTENLSWSTILQGLGGFFVAIGAFHIVTKKHTLELADRIEQQTGN